MSEELKTNSEESNEDVYDFHGRDPSQPDFDNEFIGMGARKVLRDKTMPKVVAMDVQPNPKPKLRPNAKGIARLATGALAVGVIGGGIVVPEIIDNANGIQYSPESFDYEVQQGDSLQKIILNAIDGGDKVDIQDLQKHIMTDPANVDIFKDGTTLHGGEIIVLPVSVDD